MLTLSPVFPRSIRFAIAEVDAALARIAAQGGAEGRVLNAEEWGATPQYPGLNTQHAALGPRHEAERATGRLHSALAYQRVEEVFATGLHAYLVDLQRQCYQIGEHIQEQYFAHRPLRAEEVVA